MAEEQETGSTPVNMEQPSQDEVLTLSSSQEPNMATDVGDMSQDEVVELSSQEPEDAVDNSVYCQLGFAKIGRCDYLTLRTGVRLNDEVINGMLHYLSRDIDWCHCFTTRFMNRYLETTGENQQDHNMSLSERRYEGVRRWTRGINLMTKEVVLFPINSDDHWYLIAVTNLSGSQPSITVMNSLQNIGSVPEFVAAVKEYLYHELNLSSFQLHVPQVPRQSSRNDCGIFCILYAKFLLQNLHDFEVPTPYNPPPEYFDSFDFVVGEERQRHSRKLVQSGPGAPGKGRCCCHHPKRRRSPPHLPLPYRE